jgi:hypothetical protein
MSMFLPFAALVTLIAGPPAPPSTNVAGVSSPLHVFRSGHIGVDVKVNGQGPFRLVLDTGSPVTFISTKVAKKLGIPGASGAAANSGMLGMGMSLNPFAKLKSIAIGGTIVKNLDIMVLDHPIIQMLGSVEGPVDGIIGFTFFARFKTTLDYAARQVTFAPVSYDPPDIMKSMFQLLMNRNDAKRIVAPAAMWGFTVDKVDESAGLHVTHVYPGSAADAAGLKTGDTISTLDGRWTDSILDLFEMASTIGPGTSTTLHVFRDGKPLDIVVRPRDGL